MPFPRRLTIYLLAFCTLCAALLGQEASKPNTSAADVDLPAFMKETQQSVNEAGYVGLVWWIPNQFWEVAAERAGMSPETAKERYAPLRKYTLIVVAVGKAGIANIDYISEPVIRDATTLRDSDGTVYRPVQKVSGDADGLLALNESHVREDDGTVGSEHPNAAFPSH